MYKTKNLFLAELGIVDYEAEKGEYTIGSDKGDNSYTFVYYRKGEKAKDAFSNTRYCVFEQTNSLYSYKGTTGIINLYSVTTFMDVPSDYVSSKELVRILNEKDPYRKANVKDIVLLTAFSLNRKALQVLDESELNNFNDRLLELINTYVEESEKTKTTNSIDSDNSSIKHRYIAKLLELDFELNNSKKAKKSDINEELESIKLIFEKR